jgi:hypothetical protein
LDLHYLAIPDLRAVLPSYFFFKLPTQKYPINMIYKNLFIDCNYETRSETYPF